MALSVHTKKVDRPYGIHRGRGVEMVLWSAWREGREQVLGYGNTEQGAIDDLKYYVQPDWDGTLDGEGAPKGPVIGGNMFPYQEILEHNKRCFSGNEE